MFTEDSLFFFNFSNFLSANLCMRTNPELTSHQYIIRTSSCMTQFAQLQIKCRFMKFQYYFTNLMGFHQPLKAKYHRKQLIVLWVLFSTKTGVSRYFLKFSTYGPTINMRTSEFTEILYTSDSHRIFLTKLIMY